MKIATPRVQLIGFTTYVPPMDETNTEPVLDPHEGLESHGESLAEFAGRSCYESYGRKYAPTATMEGYLANIITSEHGSVLEHSVVSFYITGISRACSHEIVRHRHFSYSQLSQRYVDSRDARVVVPPVLRGAVINDFTVDRVFESASSEMVRLYSDLDRFQEDVQGEKNGKTRRGAARAMLPEATETKLVMTGNLRAWMDFLNKRISPTADAEIRELAELILAQLEVQSPNVFAMPNRALWARFEK